MRARLAVYSPNGTTFRGYLPTVAESLQFSDELGGAGTLQFSAIESDLQAVNAWESVAVVQVQTAAGAWVVGPGYTLRRDYTHRAGSPRFDFTGRGLLESWGDDAVLLPEYSTGTMPRKAGKERGVGWMMSSYNPATDPHEPWDRCYNTSRSTFPDDWPVAATDARWISATGATPATEGKFFRAWLTITGSAAQLVKFWMSSDESATLWCAGERLIVTDSVETGKTQVWDATTVLFPGTYAVGVFTVTHFSKGGDGIDPIVVAAATVDDVGDPSTWILKTNESTWVACRRDNEPPNNIPPGPTPGAALIDLISEVQARGVSGWPHVTLDFTPSTDSYGQPWGSEVMVERVFQYGHDSFWQIFQSLAESDDVDVWMTGFTLHAAPRQGQPRSLTLTGTHLARLSEQGSDNRRGTWALAEYHDGWFYTSAGGTRREYMLEVGQALTNPVVSRIARASMKDSWRWDAAGALNPPAVGWTPYVDVKVGDWVAVDFQDVTVGAAVVASLSARAGEGGLLWDIELTEFLPRTGPDVGSGRVAPFLAVAG